MRGIGKNTWWTNWKKKYDETPCDGFRKDYREYSTGLSHPAEDKFMHMLIKRSLIYRRKSLSGSLEVIIEFNCMAARQGPICPTNHFAKVT